MNIIFFGGSSVTNEYYTEVYTKVKKMLEGKENLTIITGGTTGAMDAVAKAAKEQNINTVGVVLDKWKSYLNKYNDKVYTFDNEIDRLQHMLKMGDVFICLDGDLGTLAELFVTWFYAADVNKKLYITGTRVKELIEKMYDNKYITYKKEDYITYSSLEDLKNII